MLIDQLILRHIQRKPVQKLLKGVVDTEQLYVV